MAGPEAARERKGRRGLRGDEPDAAGPWRLWGDLGISAAGRRTTQASAPQAPDPLLTCLPSLTFRPTRGSLHHHTPLPNTNLPTSAREQVGALLIGRDRSPHKLLVPQMQGFRAWLDVGAQLLLAEIWVFLCVRLACVCVAIFLRQAP